LCHRQSGRTAHRPRSKPAPTNFDSQLNSHTQPDMPFDGLRPRNSWITTHLPTLKRWKAELAWLADP